MTTHGIHGNLLEVTVVSCNKLKDTEWISRQDPYVCVEYGSNRSRTRTCTDGGKNPTFQEKFVYSLIEGLKELNVNVWNSNTVKHDSFIGSGKVQLAQALSQGFDDSTWPLQSKSGRHSGEVRMIIHYSSAHKPANNHAQSAQPFGAPHASYSAPPPPPSVSYPPPASAAPYPPTGGYPAPSPYPSYPPNSGSYQPSPYPPNSGNYLGKRSMGQASVPLELLLAGDGIGTKISYPVIRSGKRAGQIIGSHKIKQVVDGIIPDPVIIKGGETSQAAAAAAQDGNTSQAAAAEDGNTKPPRRFARFSPLSLIADCMSIINNASEMAE